MEIIKGKIGNALTSVAADHVVAVTKDIFDEKVNKYQEDINKYFEEKINTKQDKLIAGPGIKIDGVTISSTAKTSVWGSIIGDIKDQKDLIEELCKINSAVSGEETKRKKADEALKKEIHNESDSRKLADEELSNKISEKQDKLIAGKNIQIASDGKTISATDTSYDDTEIKKMIAANAAAISAETSERKSADITLQTNIEQKQDKLIVNADIQIASDGKTISTAHKYVIKKTIIDPLN